jgi:formyl-CoA transferase
VAHRGELVGDLAAAIDQWPRDRLVTALQDADVPAGPVNSVSEALAAMEATHPGWIQHVGEMRLAPNPLRVDGEQLSVRRPPPHLGEHTIEVLRQAGLASEEIAALEADGVIG